MKVYGWQDHRPGVGQVRARVYAAGMQLRHKSTHELCSASSFNVHSLDEIIVCYDDDMTSDSLHNYDALLKTGPRAGQWVALADAFKQHDVITDNYNTSFAEPRTNEDRERGYSL